ncbi:PAS domain-containing protein [Burkholderia anthina]|uniref:PAS domain-containing protein n=1 Tax=Burkholderia anthina TaxID=179879 RepID=UPI001AA0A3D1|nr:PAS domain-containing protein [Burkholderia anthina]QTD93052.1 PAS domain-containing protein [Burkholderia anthina]
MEKTPMIADTINDLRNIENNKPKDKPVSDPKAVLSTICLPACIIDGRGYVVSLNEPWRKLINPSIDPQKYNPWAELINPSDRYRAVSNFCAALVKGNCISFECRLNGSDIDSKRWYIATLQPTRNLEWLCIFFDIDEIKTREISLERRASIQSDMLDISVDCIKLVATDGMLLHMNKAGCQALGIPENSAFGMPWLDLLPADIQPAGRVALNLAKEGKSGRFPGRSVDSNGRIQHWDNMLTPVMGPAGQVTTILCISREVTREIESRDVNQQLQDRLNIVTRFGDVGFFEFDVHVKCIALDDHCCKILSLNITDDSRSIDELGALVHPEDMQQAVCVTSIDQGPSASRLEYFSEFRIIRSGGEIRKIRLVAYLTRNPQEPGRVFGMISDITDKALDSIGENANPTPESDTFTRTYRNLSDFLQLKVSSN